MGLLDDILAKVDNVKRVAKRNLSDLISDPADYGAMVAGRLKDQNAKLASKDSEAISDAIANLIPGGSLGAIRWQGSPNFIKGTRFDMSKLGTGEGAQVNGLGHYVAELPAVADRYRESLSIRKLLNKLHDTSASFPDSFDGELADLLGKKSELLSPEKKFIAALHQNDYLGYDTPRQGMIASSRSDARDTYDLGETLDSAIKSMGHLYKVDVPDEAIAKMINFDLPIAEQSHVLKQLGDKVAGLPKDTTGRDIFKQLESSLGKKGAQDFFNSVDIPGVTYLDQGSRGKNGTVNNVLFKDDLARILERNGKPTGEKPWLPGEYGYNYKPPTEAEKDAAMQNILQFLKDSGVTP